MKHKQDLIQGDEVSRPEGESVSTSQITPVAPGL